MEPALRLASAGRALDRVQSGLALVDTVLKLGEGAGLPLILRVALRMQCPANKSH